jgi:hypothetical protein
MHPWAGGASRTIDSLDEAIEASTPFRGLRRPQAVAQYNPVFITESNPNTLIGNRKFNFMS